MATRYTVHFGNDAVNEDIFNYLDSLGIFYETYYGRNYTYRTPNNIKIYDLVLEDSDPALMLLALKYPGFQVLSTCVGFNR